MEGELAASVRPGASSFSARQVVDGQVHLESCCGAVRILRVAALINLDCEVPLYKVHLCSLALASPIMVFGCYNEIYL